MTYTCKICGKITKEISINTYTVLEPREDCNMAYKLDCGHYMFDDKLSSCPDFGTEKDFDRRYQMTTPKLKKEIERKIVHIMSSCGDVEIHIKSDKRIDIMTDFLHESQIERLDMLGLKFRYVFPRATYMAKVVFDVTDPRIFEVL